MRIYILIFFMIYINAVSAQDSNTKSDSVKINKAKELYYRYGGSSYQMFRGGVIEEYESYNISKDIENIWLNELFDKGFEQLDINDFNTAYPLWHTIETHCSANNLKRFIDFLSNRINEANNQYYLHRYGYQIFSLLVNMSKSCDDFPRELKIKCVEIAELINDKAKQAKIPKDFKIPNFTSIGEGLTQEQYVYRSIIDLDYKLELIKILK
jgi:hypothetical protein